MESARPSEAKPDGEDSVFKGRAHEWGDVHGHRSDPRGIRKGEGGCKADRWPEKATGIIEQRAAITRQRLANGSQRPIFPPPRSPTIARGYAVMAA